MPTDESVIDMSADVRLRDADGAVRRWINLGVFRRVGGRWV